MSKSHPRRAAATLVACVIALSVAACGGGTSKKDVIARGNAICASTLRSVRAVVPPSTTTTGSGTALNGYLQRELPLVTKEVSQLRKLPRPSADKAILDKYIAAITAAGAEYRTLAAAAHRNDLAAVANALGKLRASPAGSLAKQYGLTQCAAAAATSAP